MFKFNKKRVQELEVALNDKEQLFRVAHREWGRTEKLNEELKAQNAHLLRTIQQMDNIIFSMGQCTDWDSMRSHFNQLHEQMTARKVAESNRIGAIIESELIRNA